MSSRLNILDKYATILYWILVVIWMIVIFYFSSQPGGVSDSFSKNITEVIVNFIANIINIPIDIAQQYLYSLNHIIRKIAHFTEYLILALLVINAFRESGVKKFKLYLYSFLLCILYAISDEFHQLFVPGRAGQLKDVLIDSLGSICGIYMHYLKYRKSMD